MTRRVKMASAARSASARALVSVVDDDESVREALRDLLMELGYAAQAFSSAEEFLKSDSVSTTLCLMLDITMPDMSGPELQQELNRREDMIPIIFITARADESLRQSLIARGAIDCLVKPFSEQALKAALDAALRKREPRE